MPSGGAFDSLVGVVRSVTGDFWESEDMAEKDFFSAKRAERAIDITRGSPLLALKPHRSFSAKLLAHSLTYTSRVGGG